ncbi:DUF4296 domain-containing protein [Gaoshiqia sp. Z1-71]|uniref:DUF4296 domain-containing protein n=1 Tax=Gaoshiqia hydrogeniformans TaxID=3290090 RepID=UPI003BF82603
MKKNLLIIFIGFVLIALSCKEKGYPKPKNLIGEKKMVEILYDIHLYDAVDDKYKYQRFDSLKIDSKVLYQTILDKHQLTDSLLAQSLIYYSSRPKVYEKIYGKVIERFNLQQEEMKKLENISVIEP